MSIVLTITGDPGDESSWRTALAPLRRGLTAQDLARVLHIVEGTLRPHVTGDAPAPPQETIEGGIGHQGVGFTEPAGDAPPQAGTQHSGAPITAPQEPARLP